MNRYFENAFVLFERFLAGVNKAPPKAFHLTLILYMVLKQFQQTQFKNKCSSYQFCHLTLNLPVDTIGIIRDFSTSNCKVELQLPVMPEALTPISFQPVFLPFPEYTLNPRIPSYLQHFIYKFVNSTFFHDFIYYVP